MASASLQLLFTSKVNQCLSDLTLGPLHDHIEDTPLSSTFRRDVPTTAFSSGAGLQPPTTQPIMTTTTDTQQNRPLGDANRTVGFREPVSNIMGATPLSYSPFDPTAQLASAIDKLAITTETS